MMRYSDYDVSQSISVFGGLWAKGWGVVADVTLSFNYHFGEDRAWPRVLETCKFPRDETIFSIFTLSGTLFRGSSDFGQVGQVI